MNGDSNVVSVIGIEEGINYIKTQFIAKLDDNVDEIINKYTAMTTGGVLSSANIDQIALEIKAKITQLQNNFDTLSAELTKAMAQSSEEVSTSTSTIENTTMPN